MKIFVKNRRTGMNKMAIGVFLLCAAVLANPNQSRASNNYHYAEAKQTTGKRVTLKVTDQTLVSILSDIKTQTGLVFGFQESGQSMSKELYSIHVENVTVEEALTTLLKNSPYTFRITDGVIQIITRQAAKTQGQAVQEALTVQGKVTDKEGNPLPGVRCCSKVPR